MLLDGADALLVNELALKEEGRSFMAWAQENGHSFIAWQSRGRCFANKGHVSDTWSQILVSPFQSRHPTRPPRWGAGGEDNLFFALNFGTFELT